MRALGAHLTQLTNVDLVRALSGKVIWQERKQLLTANCSARWADTITRANNDLLALARRNLVRAARHGARTRTSLEVRIVTRLLALAAGLWLNHLLGYPERHLAAYDH